MSYIATKELTPSQAKYLVSVGFVLKLVALLSGNKDRYIVYGIGSN